VKNGALSDVAAPQMYTMFEQTPWPFLCAVVRTTGEPEAVAGSMRAMLARIDPMQASEELKTLDQYVARRWRRRDSRRCWSAGSRCSRSCWPASVCSA
jgi:hypothetical protein